MKKIITFFTFLACMSCGQVMADVTAPTLSALPEGGSFTGETMTVTITNPSPGKMVRYTTSDSYWPWGATNVSTFTGGSKTITITTTTTIRAIAVDGTSWSESESMYSETVGRTYYKKSEILGYVNLRAVIDPQVTGESTSIPDRDAYYGTFYYKPLEGSDYVGYDGWVLPNACTTLTAFFSDDVWKFQTAYNSGAVLMDDPVVIYTTCWDIYGHYNNSSRTNNEHPELLDWLSSDKKYLSFPIVYTIKKGSAIRDRTYKADGKNDLEGCMVSTDLTTIDGYDPTNNYYYALQMHHNDGACYDEDGNLNNRTCELCGISGQNRCPHIGFFWMNSTGEGFTTGAMRAYLCEPKSKFASASSGAKSNGFLFSEALDNMDDTATGINNVCSSNEESAENHYASTKQGTYNLAGQRVNSMLKGIYIVNGKKTIK